MLDFYLDGRQNRAPSFREHPLMEERIKPEFWMGRLQEFYPSARTPDSPEESIN